MLLRSVVRRAFEFVIGAALLLTLAAPFAFAQAPADSLGHAQSAPVTPPPAAHETPPAAAPAAGAAAGAAATHAAPAHAAPAHVAPDSVIAESSPPVSPKAPDGGWPRLITTASGGSLILYQPQILSWDNQKLLKAMGAISYASKGSTTPKLGTLKIQSPTSVAMDERMVNLQKISIEEINFSTLDKSAAQEVATEVQKSLPTGNMVIALDRVLAAVDKSQIGAKGVKINTEPPPIFVSPDPSILVQTDTTPIMMSVSGTTLKYVVNTNWDLFQDTKTNIWYLRKDTYWLQTSDLKDPKKWEPAKKLPDDFKKLPADDNWKAVKENIPGKGISKSKMPVVFFSDKPAELILVDGKAKTEPVMKKSNLLWVENTEADLFQMKKGDYYYLVSGRWFKSKSLDGPWTFATNDLPPEFSQIPPDHARARVRSSVPGTDEAAEAVLLASIPKTARVDKKNLEAPTVSYSGDPEFKPIEGTTLYYAVNSPNDVIKVGNQYYLCFQAIWFKSGNPNGPWEVTTDIPPEIYKIPSDSPVNNVTYVTVVDNDPEYPSYGYTAGYVGVSIAFGCAMWGGGYYYPPYYHYPPMGPPIYYPRPVAYGGGAVYNPRTGAYGYAQHAYGPYGGVSRAATYNPKTGTYARGGKAYGPGGSSGWAQAYNPRTGTAASTRQGSNVYGSWGSSTVARGDNWAKTQRVTDNNGNTRWAAQGSGGGSAKGWNGQNSQGFVGQKGNGDVYAGKDGNVYRKTDSGWQQWNGSNGGAGGGGWNDVNGGNRPSNQPAGGAGTRPSAGTQPSTGTRPSAGTQPSTRPSNPNTMNQLNNDARARSTGNTRTQQNYGGSRSSAAARPSGGARGGGGGRRR